MLNIARNYIWRPWPRVNVSSRPVERIKLQSQSLMLVSDVSQSDIHINLEKELEANDKLTIKCHRNCVSTYMSKYHIKQAILNVCDLRNDEWANHVKIRIQGAVSS